MTAARSWCDVCRKVALHVVANVSERLQAPPQGRSTHYDKPQSPMPSTRSCCLYQLSKSPQSATNSAKLRYQLPLLPKSSRERNTSPQ